MAETTNTTARPVPVNTTTADDNHMPEIIDNPGDFFERNKNILLGIAAAIAIIAGAIFAYSQYRNSQNEEAQEAMFRAQYYFEQDSLNKALRGDGKNLGLIAIADEYSGTKAGDLAAYYVGYGMLKQGKFQEAVDYFQKFDAGDYLVQARAYALTGDAYSELNDYGNAAQYYKKAADHYPNKYFTPMYLMKLAMVQEAEKDYSAAIQTYDKIIKEYFESAETPEARKYKARAEGLASAK